MTREEAIKWLKHCAETDCDDCAYEIQPIEWCSEKMAYCVSVLEEALTEPSECESCKWYEPNHLICYQKSSAEPSLEAIKKQIDEHWYLDKTDLISRSDAIEAVRKEYEDAINIGDNGDAIAYDVERILSALPSANYITEKPNDVVESQNDVIKKPRMVRYKLHKPIEYVSIEFDEEETITHIDHYTAYGERREK